MTSETHDSWSRFRCSQSGDKFAVTARVTNSTGARIYFEHFLFRLPEREVLEIYGVEMKGLRGGRKKEKRDVNVSI